MFRFKLGPERITRADLHGDLASERRIDPARLIVSCEFLELDFRAASQSAALLLDQRELRVALRSCLAELQPAERHRSRNRRGERRRDERIRAGARDDEALDHARRGDDPIVGGRQIAAEILRGGQRHRPTLPRAASRS